MVEIARVIKPNGLCLSFGWSTNGLGKKRGFEIIEILLVAHGGNHNDTIVTIEKKVQNQLNLKEGIMIVNLTRPEKNNLVALICRNIFEDRIYYGNERQYWKRVQKIYEKLKAASATDAR